MTVCIYELGQAALEAGYLITHGLSANNEQTSVWENIPTFLLPMHEAKHRLLSICWLNMLIPKTTLSNKPEKSV